MIDHTRLREMEEDFGSDELALILASFLVEASAAVEALREGWCDERVRRDRLHFLKGCSRTVGALELGDLCERLECSAPASADFTALQDAFQSIRAALKTTTRTAA